MSLGKKKWMLLGAFIICVAIAVLVTASARDDHSWNQSDAKLGHQPVFKDAIEEVSLTLRPEGFPAAEVKPQGRRFLLSVDNRTGLKELVFRVSRDNGDVVREIRVAGDGGDWSELLELDQGRYRFFEAGHPSWFCAIVVQKSPK